MYFKSIKERDKKDRERLFKQYRQDEHIKYLKDNQKAITKRLYEILTVVLRKRKETVARSKCFIAMTILAKLCIKISAKVNIIKKDYHKKLKQQESAFLIQK